MKKKKIDHLSPSLGRARAKHSSKQVSKHRSAKSLMVPAVLLFMISRNKFHFLLEKNECFCFEKQNQAAAASCPCLGFVLQM